MCCCEHWSRAAMHLHGMGRTIANGEKLSGIRARQPHLPPLHHRLACTPWRSTSSARVKASCSGVPSPATSNSLQDGNMQARSYADASAWYRRMPPSHGPSLAQAASMHRPRASTCCSGVPFGTATHAHQTVEQSRIRLHKHWQLHPCVAPGRPRCHVTCHWG